MPYRRAHWYLLALLALSLLAFWPQYLSQFPTAPLAFHLHGVTAGLWLLLLIVQSLTITRGDRAVHRTLGLISLVLFPLFLAGGVGIFLGMAERFVARATPFHALFPPRLALLDAVAVAGFAWFYFQGLRHRRTVQLHARYMLATSIFLMPPILGRLMPFPPVMPGVGEDSLLFGLGFQVANLIAAATAFVLAGRSGKHGKPWLIAGGLIILSALLFQFVGGSAWWKSLFAQFASIPLGPTAVAVAACGAAIAAAGWIAGRAPRPPMRLGEVVVTGQPG